MGGPCLVIYNDAPQLIGINVGTYYLEKEDPTYVGISFAQPQTIVKKAFVNKTMDIHAQEESDDDNGSWCWSWSCVPTWAQVLFWVMFGILIAILLAVIIYMIVQAVRSHKKSKASKGSPVLKKEEK